MHAIEADEERCSFVLKAVDEVFLISVEDEWNAVGGFVVDDGGHGEGWAGLCRFVRCVAGGLVRVI